MMTSILVPLTFGFIVFILGLKLIEWTMQRYAWRWLARWLRKYTSTPLRGLLAGTVATAVLQSSTAVTVLTLGFVNGGVLPWTRSAGLILGANIGTSVTTELVSLPLLQSLNAAAPMLLLVCIIAGFVSAFIHRSRWRQGLRAIGGTGAGFALLLMGMVMMQHPAPLIEASAFFRTFIQLAHENALWALLAGALMTAAVHSSAAVISLLMGFAATGALPLELAIAVVIGANVGTCATALLAAFSGSANGRKVAYLHLALNTLGAVLFMPLLHPFTAWIEWLSADSIANQVARSQTIYNVVCSLLALPLLYLFRRPGKSAEGSAMPRRRNAPATIRSLFG